MLSIEDSKGDECISNVSLDNGDMEIVPRASSEIERDTNCFLLKIAKE